MEVVPRDCAKHLKLTQTNLDQLTRMEVVVEQNSEGVQKILKILTGDISNNGDGLVHRVKHLEAMFKGFEKSLALLNTGGSDNLKKWQKTGIVVAVIALLGGNIVVYLSNLLGWLSKVLVVKP